MLETFRNLARSVFGMNHVKDTENQYLEVVGNGLDAEHPRNARTLDIAGNEVLAGRLTVGAQPVDDNDVATKKYVDDNASSVLPAVTAEDNGDVLKVVEGAWTNAAPSGGGGGGGGFKVTFTDFSWQANTATADKSYDEIQSALDEGQIVYAVADIGQGQIVYMPLIQNDGSFEFSVIIATPATGAGGSVQIFNFGVTEDYAWCQKGSGQLSKNN